MVDSASRCWHLSSVRLATIGNHSEHRDVLSTIKITLSAYTFTNQRTETNASVFSVILQNGDTSGGVPFTSKQFGAPKSLVLSAPYPPKHDRPCS